MSQIPNAVAGLSETAEAAVEPALETGLETALAKVSSSVSPADVQQFVESGLRIAAALLVPLLTKAATWAMGLFEKPVVPAPAAPAKA